VSFKVAVTRVLIPACAVATVIAVSFQGPLALTASSAGYGGYNCGVKGNGYHDHGKLCPNRPFPGKGKGIAIAVANGNTSPGGTANTTAEGNNATTGADNDDTTTTGDGVALLTGAAPSSTGKSHGHGKGHGRGNGHNQ
jgi:hypothetical protein